MARMAAMSGMVAIQQLNQRIRCLTNQRQIAKSKTETSCRVDFDKMAAAFINNMHIHGFAIVFGKYARDDRCEAIATGQWWQAV